MRAPAADYVRHMRLSFQLLLAPIFLWGASLAGGSSEAAAAIGFVSFHLFLYPGATAFNAAFDRDTGPVSGSFAPPPVPPGLLAFSLALQAIGAALALLVGLHFLLLYAALALVFVGYSHPVTRWKAAPVPSALAVALGQGALGFAAGWCAVGGELDGIMSPPGLLGAAAAALTTLGIYPSTQIFQTEEDAQRGDRTLAVALGPSRALLLGSLCLALGGAAAALVLASAGERFEALLLAGGYAVLIVRHVRLAARLGRAAIPVDTLFRWATATRLLATAGFLAFLVARIAL